LEYQGWNHQLGYIEYQVCGSGYASLLTYSTVFDEAQANTKVMSSMNQIIPSHPPFIAILPTWMILIDLALSLTNALFFLAK
jgi:hypothetical protein